MTASLSWQKSTYSQEQGDCVELAVIGGAVLLRESDNPAVVLRTSRANLADFLQVIRQGPAKNSPPGR
ncbi:DUF397 domain-containing protein [Actinacidiphila acididurans]|uniref:DUF397 domain-containing protein n=1 Tax=Actinacidiphila acididurans TaxID=2784346 RepID=A0ABS2U5K4_9ACTN|nr:DUF397 domain-containing protein [Actinacidiphila acididurans]MBM9510642.1 DUF397 domain-containing protein [Actinacidiphila acididurans]